MQIVFLTGVNENYKKACITYNQPATYTIPGAPVTNVSCLQSLIEYATPAKIMTATS